MATSQTNDAQFEADVLKAGKPVLVDFYADWCGPCKQIAPILEEISGERTDIEIKKLNIDENPQRAMEFGVRGIPTMILFHEGAPAATKVGVVPKTDILRWIEDAIGA